MPDDKPDRNHRRNECQTAQLIPSRRMTHALLCLRRRKDSVHTNPSTACSDIACEPERAHGKGIALTLGAGQPAGLRCH